MNKEEILKKIENSNDKNIDDILLNIVQERTNKKMGITKSRIKKHEKWLNEKNKIMTQLINHYIKEWVGDKKGNENLALYYIIDDCLKLLRQRDILLDKSILSMCCGTENESEVK